MVCLCVFTKYLLLVDFRFTVEFSWIKIVFRNRGFNNRFVNIIDLFHIFPLNSFVCKEVKVICYDQVCRMGIMLNIPTGINKSIILKHL